MPSEVDLKSKVGCFLPKSPQVVLGTRRRLKVDLGSLLYQVGSDWHTKVAPRSTITVNLLAFFKQLLCTCNYTSAGRVSDDDSNDDDDDDAKRV